MDVVIADAIARGSCCWGDWQRQLFTLESIKSLEKDHEEIDNGFVYKLRFKTAYDGPVITEGDENELLRLPMRYNRNIWTVRPVRKNTLA